MSIVDLGRWHLEVIRMVGQMYHVVYTYQVAYVLMLSILDDHQHSLVSFSLVCLL